MSTHSPEDPSSLRSYRLIAEIGRGGMANVYLAVARGPAGFNKLVVIKKVRKDLVTEGDNLAMFLDEARLSARMNHPNVVQTYEIGQEGDRYFIAMEYLDGQPYSRVLSRLRGKLPFAYHLRIVADLLAGLHHAHELRDFDGTPLGVVHRDATPQNVFITYDGSIKVVDFGIAKAQDASSQTRTGVVKGKVTYMAPEQVRGERLDRRTDIFAAGVMLWEAIAGRRMWEEMPDLTIVHELMYDRVPSLAGAVANVPPELARICERAVAPARDARYATALEMQREIEDYLTRWGQRSGARDVGEMIAGEFESDRQRVRTVIESQLRDLRWTGVQPRATAQDLPTIDEAGAFLPSNPAMSAGADTGGGRVLIPNQQRVTGQHSAPVSVPPSMARTGSGPLAIEAGPVTSPSTHVPVPGPISIVPTNAGTAMPLPPPPSPQRSLAVPALVGALASLAVVAVGVRFLVPDAPPKAAALPQPTVTASVSATPPEPEAVKLTVRTRPAEARIYLDDVLLSTGPFEGKVLRSATPRVVRVEAEKHLSKQEQITFTSDMVLSFDLEKDESAAPTATAAPLGPAKPLPGKRPGAQKPLRDIDSDSPYKK